MQLFIYVPILYIYNIIFIYNTNNFIDIITLFFLFFNILTLSKLFHLKTYYVIDLYFTHIYRRNAMSADPFS